ncbi:MAG TPA: hypothetical protein PKA37_05770, partial [Planctomycetota bacterium]|nr:hypothetical protein [Planctomycetota bacterium]
MRTLTALLLTFALLVCPAIAQKYLGPGSPGSGGFSPVLRVTKPNAGDPNFNISMSLGMGGATGILVLSPNATNVLMGNLPIYVDLGTALTPFLPIALDGPPGVPGAGSFTL